MEQMKWFEREFGFDAPLAVFPSVVERLRGTPARLEERVDGDIRSDLLTRQLHGRWSIKAQVGHLGDLEELWIVRLGDLLNGEEVMTEADLTNRQTHEAGHNEKPLETLLARFREKRGTFVGRLEGLEEPEVARTSLHPRLEQPMRVLDLARFVAEHDDHHLAFISKALS